MKKLSIILAGVAVLGIAGGTTIVAHAANNVSDRPDWVSISGTVDYAKIPDTAQIPYQCWSGKQVTLSGKLVKAKHAAPNAAVGSTEHKRGVAKANELAKVPGIITKDAKGGQVVNLDESNPKVQKIMKKYEAMETPQCR